MRESLHFLNGVFQILVIIRHTRGRTVDSNRSINDLGTEVDNLDDVDGKAECRERLHRELKPSSQTPSMDPLELSQILIWL